MQILTLLGKITIGISAQWPPACSIAVYVAKSVHGADIAPAADQLLATIHSSCCLYTQALSAKLYTLTHLRRCGGWEGTRLHGSCKAQEQGLPSLTPLVSHFRTLR